MNRRLQLDGHKLLYHIPTLNKWKRGEQFYPVLIEISPVGYCNQRCVFCAYNYLKGKKQFLERSRMLELVDEFAGLGVKSLFYSGEGEPLLHPHLAEFIIYGCKKGLDNALNTNGFLLTKDISEKILKCLSWVRFSINGGSAESYQRIHQAGKNSFRVVLENIKDAVAIKKKNNLGVTLGIQCVYIGQPFEELYEFGSMLKKIGADYFSIKPFNQHPLISFRPQEAILGYRELSKIEDLSDDRFISVVRKNFLPEVKNRSYKECYGLEFFSEIGSDGDLCPCGPLLGLKQYSYGNIYRNTFKEIWMGGLRREVLQKIMAQIDTLSCMENCRLNNANNFLWQLKKSPAHVNFI